MNSNSSLQNIHQHNNPADDPLLKSIMNLCERNNPFQKQKNLHIKAIRDICSKNWQKPIYQNINQDQVVKKELEINHIDHQIGQNVLNETFNKENQQLINPLIYKKDSKYLQMLSSSDPNIQSYLFQQGQIVSTQKKINYFLKKRASYAQILQSQNQKLYQQKLEYAQLKSIYERYEFQTYEEIMEEIQNIMQSNDYQDSEHLQEQVKELKQKAPGLERFGRAKNFIKELKCEILELEHYLRDTVEDLKRLKIRMKFLLKQKIKEVPVYQQKMKDQNNQILKSDSNNQMLSQDVSISQISYFSNNSWLIKKQNSIDPVSAQQFKNYQQLDNNQQSSQSSEDEDSSKSLKSMIKAENFFKMRTNSFNMS